MNGIYLWFIFRLLLQPGIKMWIMYDKSQLVEQIAKPAEPVNDNLKKSKSPAGAEVKNNKIWRKNKWE